MPSTEIVLEPYKWYRIRYRLQSENGQWYAYECITQILAHSKQEFEQAEVITNYRPLAGTGSLPLEDILSAEEVPWEPPSGGSREASPAKLPKKLPGRVEGRRS